MVRLSGDTVKKKPPGLCISSRTEQVSREVVGTDRSKNENPNRHKIRGRLPKRLDLPDTRRIFLSSIVVFRKSGPGMKRYISRSGALKTTWAWGASTSLRAVAWEGRRGRGRQPAFRARQVPLDQRTTDVEGARGGAAALAGEKVPPETERSGAGSCGSLGVGGKR